MRVLARLLRLTLATLALMVVLTPTRAAAGPILVSGTDVNSLVNNAGFVYGFEFQPTTALSLTALGLWDFGADGLPAAFPVGLWETATQTLLASASIDNADPLSGVNVSGGQYRYETLGAPVVLSPSLHYTIAYAAGVLLDAPNAFVILPAASATFDSVMFIVSTFVSGTSLATMPTQSLGAGVVIGQVNALVTPVDVQAVPEPATVLLLSAGLGGIVLRRKMQRR